MILKVELGFTDAGASPPFFTLNDAVKGVLDNTAYVLGGGEGYVDVSAYVRSVNIQRGKSRELDRYDAGQLSVTFNNTTRAFDPTFVASPFYGQIVPKRKIRVSANNIVQFVGLVEDWNIDYDASGYSLATCQAFDAFSQLADVKLFSFAPSEELTGTRINNALDAIGWSATNRAVDVGRSLVAAETVTDGTGVLSYLQTVTDSDPGDIFTNKAGAIEFQDRSAVPTSSGLVFTDTGAGIPYENIKAVYGSELLYNFVTVSNATSSATDSDPYSISLYGQRDITINTLLANSADLATYAGWQLAKYKDPELRFEAVSVNLREITPEQVTALLNLDLATVVTVELTPANTPPTITQYGKVIALNYTFTPNDQRVEISLATGKDTAFVLDDAVFGKLNTGILGW